MLYMYYEAKKNKFLNNQFENWLFNPSCVTVAIKSILVVLSFVIGVVLVIIGPIVKFNEIIIIGGFIYSQLDFSLI